MVVLAGCSLALLCSAAPTWATYPGRNGLIAYERFAPGPRGFLTPHGIWAVNPATVHKRRLVGGEAFDPTWSPDGRLLAYRRRGHQQGIYIVRADGSHARRITDQEDKHPSFSPSGRRIAFDRHSFYQQARFTIFSVRIDGSHRRRVASGYDPSYSPNGRWIAYWQGGTGRDPSPLSLRLVHPNGSGAHPAAVPGFSDWSPEGDRIAVSAFDYQTESSYITTMNLDGSDQRSLGRVGGAGAVYSPDGRLIAFQGAPGLAAIPADGGSTKPLANIAAGKVGPFAWQPRPPGGGH